MKRVCVILFIFFGLIMTGCKKFLEIDPAPNLIESASVFQSPETAYSALAGVYTQMRQASHHWTSGGAALYGGLLSDELVLSSSNAQISPFATNSLLPTTTHVNTNFWLASYRNIYRINAVLEGVSQSSRISNEIKNQILGELLVLRSFYYFAMVNYFGPVPLVLSTDFDLNSIQSRNSTEEIYGTIIEDLRKARDLLKVTYPSAGKNRPNSLTASALLSRVYLFTRNWTEAEFFATEVIESGEYLLGNLTMVFKRNSSETIWEVASPSDAINTDQGMIFIPWSPTVVPAYLISEELRASFSIQDLRAKEWITESQVQGSSYYYPSKYRLASPSPVEEHNVVIRLAEVYLNRAEARIRQSKFHLGAEDINSIRSRAGLGLISITDEGFGISEVVNERRRELFTEWSDRWFTLKRLNLADLVLPAVKGTSWQTTDQLFPIPEVELLNNPSLTQNPGY